jgi:hypothetical protein
MKTSERYVIKKKINSDVLIQLGELRKDVIDLRIGGVEDLEV